MFRSRFQVVQNFKKYRNSSTQLSEEFSFNSAEIFEARRKFHSKTQHLVQHRKMSNIFKPWVSPIDRLTFLPFFLLY